MISFCISSKFGQSLLKLLHLVSVIIHQCQPISLGSVLKLVKKIGRMIPVQQSFHKQGMPFFLRTLRGILLGPLAEQPMILSQHRSESCRFYFYLLRAIPWQTNGTEVLRIIIDAEILSDLLSRISDGQRK